MVWRRIRGLFAEMLLGVFFTKRDLELKKFKSGAIYRSDLDGYLKDFRKSESRCELDFKDFALFYSHDLCWSQFKRVYRDAFYTLILTYKAKESDQDQENSGAIACIGFDVIGTSTILVKQIQGVSGQSEILKNFKWERMLVKIVMDWAKNAGFTTVRIINAKSSGWYCQSRAESLFMKYDVTARRSGFKFDESEKNYVKALV